MNEMLMADQLPLFMVFVVPGFVAASVYRLFSPGPKHDAALLLYQTVCYSMVNLGFTFWLPLLLLQNRTLSDDTGRFVFVGIVVLVVSPALLGFGSARARRTKWLLRYLGHPAACSWDYFFEQEQPCFVVVTLSDGTKIGGFWGEKSFASASPHKGDLYLEQTWRMEENMLGTQVNGTLGFHVRASECRLIEFLRAEEAPSVPNQG